MNKLNDILFLIFVGALAWFGMLAAYAMEN